MRVAQVVIDVATHALDRPFDYLIAAHTGEVSVGMCVLVHFAGRPAVGWVTGVSDSTDVPVERLKAVEAVLGGPYFGEQAARAASWIAARYIAPLSEALRLFTPPGGTPRAVRSAGGEWALKHAGVGPVDDRWAELGIEGRTFAPRANATMQRALLDALAAGPVRVAELAADLGSVDGALKTLEHAGAVVVTRRRRLRDAHVREHAAPRHTTLTDGQSRALEAIGHAHGGEVVLIDGVTGSGKTEVYLRAIEFARERGRGACVLVPEISLTPQTVGRFRARFGDEVAVLHSRLSPGERFDQWDRIRTGESRIVVGARSALFAPVHDLGLIVIDEEHEGSYKQGSSPRYHARDVAAHLAAAHEAVLVLGSASPSMESRALADAGEWRRIELPERVAGLQMPAVTVVDMTAEFADGHRAMFSRPLIAALERVRESGTKAVLFLNRRGFASFLLCRECGYVPRCESCSASLTYHEVGSKLTCHHCGSTRVVPVKCPECESPYLRQFGAGTQRVEAELAQSVPELPIVRMDADTTRSKGAHERLLARFEELRSGVLLGTQMIAKGLDFPEVTLVGVISADITLNLPDFRAAERTYQLLEQVAGRAGRGHAGGHVVLQTYQPQHPAVRAAAAHDPSLFYPAEAQAREALGYPPFGRLANVLTWGRDQAPVARAAAAIAEELTARVPAGWRVLGPSPAPLSRLKGNWRWHTLVKAPPGAEISYPIASALAAVKADKGVSSAADIDALDLL